MYVCIAYVYMCMCVYVCIYYIIDTHIVATISGSTLHVTLTSGGRRSGNRKRKYTQYAFRD